ncbi:glycosyltransferase [Sphaerosporella brunnea]|uniref:Dol-P-Man:Man(5)GlcNAc(2)-PP-Dol alpha-1,3-mannosyltransferase n=1 Tax=Sphaerosporella brunnea TaxID=1250544 RepID=A0A5J5ES94_9PEZI|nr:glycosyltransferase [Sphaerosporella brunnea]
MDFIRSAWAFATNSRSKFPLWIIPLLLLADALLSAVVVLKVPYTEIDWKAYMEQVTQYLAGERDYSLIKGGTGPLVYPAGHLYIYSLLYRLTDNGTNILRAQWIFSTLYLATLYVVLLCYREARAPPYILPLLLISKRLHSIYLLRLFNDPFSLFFLFVAVLLWQKRMWTLGSMAYSASISVKMNTLLVLPAVGVILLQAVGRDKAIRQATIMAQLQFVLASPFLLEYPRSYLARAFELTRQFLFKWTVNWRFVGEETFLSKQFSVGLLVVHVLLLLLFLITQWKRPSQRSFPGFVSLVFSPPTEREELQISSRVTPRYILYSILSANTIGMLCARSLHYQFYSWLAWGTPYVLWQSGLGLPWIVPLWLAQEWAWNVYPSTNISSGVVVGVLGLSTVGLLLGGKNVEEPEEKRGVSDRKKRS